MGTNNLKVAEELGEQDSDSPNTLKSFLTWAFQRCKTKDATAQVFVQFSSHGSGWFGFGGDDSKNSSSLVDDEAAAIRKIQIKNGDDEIAAIRNIQIKNTIEESMAETSPSFTKLDMLGFDACFMQSYASMYVYENITQSYLASEATEPGHGWDYTGLRPSLSVKGFAEKIVDDFVNGLHGYPNQLTPKTLAVFNSTDFSAFRLAMDALAVQMTNDLSTTRDLIARVRLDTVEFGGGPSFHPNTTDLGDFLLKFKQACETPQACGDNLINAVAEAWEKYDDMVAGGHVGVGPGTTAGATGMAMWFPANREWVELPAVQRWKEGTDGFAAAGNRPWHQFIDAYYGVGEACSYFTSSAFCPNSCVWTHDACEEQTPTVVTQGGKSGKRRRRLQVGMG